MKDILKPYDNDEKTLDYYTCTFLKSKIDRYIPSTQYPAYFTNTQRQTAVLEILDSTTFGNASRGETGVKRLIAEGVLEDAFALHDGSYNEKVYNKATCQAKASNPRSFLYFHWAKFSLWYKHQPIDQIRSYFGEKVGFYFAWLGSYTNW